MSGGYRPPLSQWQQYLLGEARYAMGNMEGADYRAKRWQEVGRPWIGEADAVDAGHYRALAWLMADQAHREWDK